MLIHISRPDTPPFYSKGSDSILSVSDGIGLCVVIRLRINCLSCIIYNN